MIRRPPRSTLDRSSAASDVYKRQIQGSFRCRGARDPRVAQQVDAEQTRLAAAPALVFGRQRAGAVSYTHLRAHETVLDIVCRLLLEKNKSQKILAEVAM